MGICAFRYQHLHDKGGKCIGQNFQWLLEICSIKDVCSTSKNPQSNAICERMHWTVNNALRTLVNTNPPQNMTQARDIMDDALATAMHAMQTTIANTLGSIPGALAFAPDKFLNVLLIADWQAIAHTCEHHVNENLQCANKKWRQFDYAPGQQVLKKVHNPTKLGVRTEGPYIIECAHINWNLTILLREGITECIKIRRVLLYCWPFHIPLWRQFLAWIVFEVFTFYPWSFFSTSHSSELWVESFESSFHLFIYGRASLAMEGKSLVPIEITFMDMEDNH